MKRRTVVVSVLLHALLLVTVYVFQSMIFPYMRLTGLVPLLLPIVGTGVAICEGRLAGGLFGIFAGILCDVSFNEPAGAFTVLLTFTGLIIGTMADSFVTRRFVTFFISCAIVLSVAAFVQIFPLMYRVGMPFQPLMSTAIGQTAYSLIFTVPIWFFVRALGKRAQRVSPPGRPI